MEFQREITTTENHRKLPKSDFLATTENHRKLSRSDFLENIITYKIDIDNILYAIVSFIIMPDIQWILFSKERTLQAKSCILSLVALSDTKAEDITVLYVHSKDVDYRPLKKEFPCRFIRENNFYRDLSDILNNTSKPLIGFIVDDLIFRDRFSSIRIGRLMEGHRGLDSFSLRLGKNIRDGKAPEFKELERGILSFRTAKGLGRSWNYFWEVSSSIFRRDFVLDYLKGLSPRKAAFPNPFEFRYYGIRPNYYIGSCGPRTILAHPRYFLWLIFSRHKMSNRIACYEKSRAFTQGVNAVARDSRFEDYISPKELHKLFLQGYRIDFESLREIANTKPNAGRRYFRIIGPGNNVHPLSVFK